MDATPENYPGDIKKGEGPDHGGDGKDNVQRKIIKRIRWMFPHGLFAASKQIGVKLLRNIIVDYAVYRRGDDIKTDAADEDDNDVRQPAE